MAQGQIAMIKDWGPHKGGPKHKYSVKLENDGNYYNTTNGAFVQQFKQGDFCTIEADEFPPGSGKYWFNRFGNAAPSSPAPESAGVIAGRAAQGVARPQGTMQDKDMEIWCQSVIKSWVGPQDDAGTVLSKIQAVYGMYPERQSREPGSDDDLSPGVPGPDAPLDDDIPF